MLHTDGFEIFRERRKPRTTWPFFFIICNLAHRYRSRAANALVSAFIPGAHSSQHFDSFIVEIIADLCILERQGVQIICAGGKHRRMRAFVVVGTTDWPAAAKTFGFASHIGTCTGRYCKKKARRGARGRHIFMLPEGGDSDRQGALHDAATAVKRLYKECPSSRTNLETRAVWEEYKE